MIQSDYGICDRRIARFAYLSSMASQVNSIAGPIEHRQPTMRLLWTNRSCFRSDVEHQVLYPNVRCTEFRQGPSLPSFSLMVYSQMWTGTILSRINQRSSPDEEIFPTSSTNLHILSIFEWWEISIDRYCWKSSLYSGFIQWWDRSEIRRRFVAHPGYSIEVDESRCSGQNIRLKLFRWLLIPE